LLLHSSPTRRSSDLLPPGPDLAVHPAAVRALAVQVPVDEAAGLAQAADDAVERADLAVLLHAPAHLLLGGGATATADRVEESGPARVAGGDGNGGAVDESVNASAESAHPAPPCPRSSTG